MKKILTIVCLLVLTSSLCWAETVYLKNGKKITGKVVQQDDQQIKVDVSGVMVTYFTDEVDRVEGKDAATAKPAPVANPEPSPELEPTLESTPEPSAAPADAVEAVPPAQNQTTSAAKKGMILTLIDVSGTRESMDAMFTQIISEAPPEQADKLKEVFNLDDIIAQFIPVYDKYFTDEDLTQLIEFYKSPVGKKLIKVTPLLMEDSMKVSMDYFKAKMPEPPPEAPAAPEAPVAP